MTDEEYIKMKMNENVLQKVTPTHTKDWYIKWAASIVLLVGMLLTANQIYPLNLFVHLVGLGGWLIVAMMWNDRSLIIINAVGIAIMANGLIKYFIGE